MVFYYLKSKSNSSIQHHIIFSVNVWQGDMKHRLSLVQNENVYTCANRDDHQYIGNQTTAEDYKFNHHQQVQLLIVVPFTVTPSFQQGI